MPACEREIRRNFLRAGESFCRLCLRSHFIRLYEVALAEKIPLIFFGLSPYQCLDCPDAIQWSLNGLMMSQLPWIELTTRQSSGDTSIGHFREALIVDS